MADGQDEKVNAVRRRLLKLAVYVPPAILGAISFLETCGSLHGGVCEPDSCAPTVCAPQTSCTPTACAPLLQNCGPHACNPYICNPNL